MSPGKSERTRSRWGLQNPGAALELILSWLKEAKKKNYYQENKEKLRKRARRRKRARKCRIQFYRLRRKHGTAE
jgi:hypothetical protein